MDNQDDEHLLSTLGVTTANPEDIERDVIAAAEESGRRKKRLESEAEEDTEVQAEGEDDWDGESRHEAMLRNRLEALDQEINAVAAGLQSLGQENRDEASTQDANAGEEEEKPQLPEEENIHSVEGLHLQRALGQEENIHSVEGLHLQRALGQERLASLKEKRGRLFQKLTTLESGLPDGSENDDDLRVTDATDAQTESRKVKFVKSADHKQKSLLTLEDDEFDFALDSTSGFVETERDRLIRTGVVTPFDRLKGFERRVKRTSSNGPITSQAETSIANAAASMAAIVKSRPTTKLLDASELPKLAPPTREFHRIRRVQRYAGPQEKSDKAVKGQVKQGKKRKRPMPDMKWRKRNRSESDGEVSFPEGQIGAASSGSEEGEVEEAKSSKERRGSKEESGFESQVEMDLKGPGDGGNMEDDVWLEGGLQIPSLIYNKLFDYQKTGVKWLWELHCQKAGGIIADEMGLGKTIQVAAFLASLHHSGLYKPSIVVCPVTLLRQWKRELQKWYGFFEVEILHDSAILHSRKSSKSRRGKAKDDESSDDGEGEGEEEREDVKPTPTKHANKWGALIERIVNSKSGLLVTTYEQLRILRELLLGHEWGYAVLDEGHRIRNPDAEVTLVCKQLQTVHRIIMTGAPIQNRLTELWSLFDFVFPGKLGVLPVFQAQFALPIAIGGYANATPLQVSTAYKCAVVLRDLIMPYLLRRLKSDVNAHLTKKTEHVLFCSLSEEQRSAYRAFLGSSEAEQIFDGNRNSLYGIDILRKICNHADLLEREHSANHPDYGNPERSGKLRVVAQVLDLWKIQGHRVLIFSQTQQMLDIIENYVISKDFTYRRMDGSTPVQQRMALIDEFNESSHVFVFILTTRVGGLGTNLIGANKVIIFDPDWNPSTDMQARERAWRIGQTRDVTIYRLITRGTIEEKVYHRQIYKHFLTNKILKDPKQRRVFKAKDLRDLFTLNEEKHESKTETSALFAELANVELSNENKQVQAPVNSMHGFGEEQEKIVVRSAVKGKAPVEDDESYEDESRILKCLFEANGIHSALNHDAIESMNDLEKMKVDNESARVAQQAATAVMQSRLQRSGDNVAVPTWTGRSGAAGAPVAVRRRFGSTMNTRLISSSTAGGSNGGEVPGSTTGGASRTETVVAGVAGSSIGRALSSTDVLARIRGRVGSGVETARPYSNGMPNGVREGSRSRVERPVQRGLEPDILIRQLRTFIEHNGGSVSSTLIVAKFKDVVPASNVAVFRQLLKEVAVLRKEGTEGRWVLKDENQS